MTKQPRNRYSDEFKAEALKLAENTSVAIVAREAEAARVADLWVAFCRQEKG